MKVKQSFRLHLKIDPKSIATKSDSLCTRRHGDTSLVSTAAGNDVRWITAGLVLEKQNRIKHKNPKTSRTRRREIFTPAWDVLGGVHPSLLCNLTGAHLLPPGAHLSLFYSLSPSPCLENGTDRTLAVNVPWRTDLLLEVLFSGPSLSVCVTRWISWVPVGRPGALLSSLSDSHEKTKRAVAQKRVITAVQSCQTCAVWLRRVV